jgi:hypothetical protein
MRLRVGLIAFVLILLAQSSTMSAARLAAAPRVVVTKSGVVRGAAGSDYAQYGLVLRNTSRTTDALDVTVNVRALDKRGHTFTTDQQTVTVIPAAKDFVVAGSLVWNVSLDLSRIVTSIRVRKGAPRGRRLPPVTHAQLTTYGDLTVSLKNPYRKPLPESATVYGLFLDRQGRIVSTDAEVTSATVPPGATVSMTLSGNYSTDVQMDAVASGKVSVDPCGGEFSRACPVAGAG